MSAAQLCGHQQDFLPQRLQCCRLELPRQTQTLKPVHEVVGQQKQMEVRFVGQVVPRRNVTQSVVALELLDDQFDGGAVVVETPEVEWLERQVGD